MCASLMNATACRHDIQIDTVRTQSAVITEIRMYPAEDPMPRASEAPFALVDIVRCSKSRTTVDAGRCSQCSPTNGSPERRRLDIPQAITGKKTYVTSSRRSLPKNLIVAHPVQGSQADEGFGGTCSPATPCMQRYGTGKPEGCGDVVLSGVVLEELDLD